MQTDPPVWSTLTELAVQTFYTGTKTSIKTAVKYHNDYKDYGIVHLYTNVWKPHIISVRFTVNRRLELAQ